MARRMTAKQLQQRLQMPLTVPSGDAKQKPIARQAFQSSASEKEIQAAILEYLNRCSSVVWSNRMNSGATKYVDRTGKTRWVKFGFPGCPDIMGQLTDGRFLAIEVKNAKGRATQEQLNFLRAVRVGRGVAILARSVEDVIEGIKK